jgi:hypothetical protein
MEWVNEYIGIPYSFSGRTRAALDCYGLVSDVYKTQLGISLPDWRRDGPSVASGVDALCRHVDSDEARDMFEEVPEPVDYDVIVVSRFGKPHHVGVFVCGGVLHSAEGVGVVFEDFPRFLLPRAKSNIRVLRWRK